MLSRIKQIMRKPYLLKRFFYNNHIGLIFKIELPNSVNPSLDFKKYGCNYSVSMSSNFNLISDFYVKKDHVGMTSEKVKKLLTMGHDCWIITYYDEVVGVFWIFFDEFESKTLSSKVLGVDNKKILPKDTGYLCKLLIDASHRGNNLFEKALRYVVFETNVYKDLVALIYTTGITNAPVIKTSENLNAKLISIVSVKKVLFLTKRRVYYKDKYFFKKKGKTYEE